MESYIAVTTVKGQIVIPADLCRKYGIGAGTRIRVIDAGDGIELRPLTDAASRNVGITPFEKPRQALRAGP